MGSAKESSSLATTGHNTRKNSMKELVSLATKTFFTVVVKIATYVKVSILFSHFG
jgi:hypothetical protein